MNRYVVSKHPYTNYYQVFDNYKCKVVYIGSYFQCRRYLNYN